jgi:hypothetical protein
MMLDSAPNESDLGEDGDAVDLSFAASPDLVVLARFTAATVASRAGFDIDEIEDLRLAVDELCVSFGPLDEATNMHLEFRRRGDTVRITCAFDILTPPPDGGAPNLDISNWDRSDDLSQQLLDALVDQHGREATGAKPCAWLEKKKGVPLDD